jgi:predicted PurR-regulated permease PerM
MSTSSGYHRIFLAILVGIITVAFLVVMRSFLITMMLAAIFTAMLYPGYRLMLSWCHERARVASALYTSLIALLVVIPAIAFVSVVVSQAIQLSEGAGTLIRDQVVHGDLNEKLSHIPFIDRIMPHREQILTKSSQITAAIAGFVVDRAKSFTKSTLNVIAQTVLMFYAMYFFMMDGHHLLRTTTEYLPLSETERRRLIDRFANVSIATIKSSVLIGVIQGALGGAGFAMAGIPGAVFWGSIMIVLAMIPGVGTALVWIPAALYLLIMDRIQATIFFSLYFLLVVGLIDNVLRPRLVGRGGQMHELLVLLSTLGGIMAFGLVGFIIGPVIAALFITLWEIQGAPVHESSDDPDDA